MQWDDLLGHTQPRSWLQTAMENRRLATSFLFVGPNGIGKRTFARLFAKSLLCLETPSDQLEHCGQCESCAQVEASTHPDLIEVCKPPEKSVLPVELLIGEREKRMREGLCHDISLKPYGGRRKIAILDDADSLNAEGANCLLKTLEEPPLNSLLILIGTSLQRQLPTIRSRCQSILFRPLDVEHIAQLLIRHGTVESDSKAHELASQAQGSLVAAAALADEELLDFQSTMLRLLSQPQLAMSELVKNCSAIVDAAGKDARAKRDRMKVLLEVAASFYRAVSLQLSAQQSEEPSSAMQSNTGNSQTSLDASARSACNHWKSGVDGAVRCWQRSLQAIEQVDRNANQASLLEAWAADLALMGGC